VHDLDFPQREAAFFYGLFLRGHSADKLRQDIEVPAVVLAKWHREAERTRSFAIFLRAWWITAATSWPSSIPCGSDGHRSAFSNLFLRLILLYSRSGQKLSATKPDCRCSNRFRG